MKTVTKWVVVAAVLVVAVYDVIALVVGGPAATISRVVGVEGSFHSPFIPFGVGFVMGHLFWAQQRKPLPAAQANYTE